MFKRKKEIEAVNEFNQTVEGNSLSKDAWRRLRKNRMAVVGMVLVVIYSLLSLFAPLLPIYPYDEIILDHQNLPPSFTKTAGELLMKTKTQELYFKAWQNGELKLDEQDNAQIKEWIATNNANKVWKLCYAEGEKQRKSGEFTWNERDQKKLDKLENKINTALQVTVKKIYYNEDGKQKNMAKMDSDQLEAIYAEMLDIDIDLIERQMKREVETQVLNNMKASNDQLTDEEALENLPGEMKSLGENGIEKLRKENLFGKIVTMAKKSAEKDLKKMAEDGSAEFPMKEMFEYSDTISLDLVATRKNSRRYLFGTDYSGRDMLSRIIYGGRVSIAIGLVGTITSVIIGILVGAIAGYAGGKVDNILMRFVDIMYGLPYMLLVIICMAVFGRNTMNLFVALALVSWLTIARMVRGQIMSLKNSEFVEAARSMGASTWRIILRHMIPNSLSVIIVYSTLRIPAFIMQESFLSFLGLGVQAPSSSWGSLVGDAINGMTLYPWRLIYPSIAMTIFLLAMNFFGDGLRDAFDPQSKNQQ